MPVYVPTPEDYSPASRALRMEGLGVDEVRCDEPLDYGRFYARAWAAGEPFVVVEWDVIPWPGSVVALEACWRPWCVHRYPIARAATFQWTPALGFAKYRPAGELPPAIAAAEWQRVDGVLVPWLHERFGQPHIHEPPVAHARPGSR